MGQHVCLHAPVAVKIARRTNPETEEQHGDKGHNYDHRSFSSFKTATGHISRTIDFRQSRNVHVLASNGVVTDQTRRLLQTPTRRKKKKKKNGIYQQNRQFIIYL